MSDRETGMTFRSYVPLWEERRPACGDNAFMMERNFPMRFMDCQLELIPDEAVHKKPLLAVADRLVDLACGYNSLLLYNSFGAGKTGAAVALARLAAQHGAYVWFVTAAELPELLKSRVPGYGETTWAYECCHRVLKQQVLVLDDLGAQRDQDFQLGVASVERVIRARYNARVTTIATSNHTPEKLATMYPGVASIMSGCDWLNIPFSGVAWRDKLTNKGKGGKRGRKS